MNDNRECDNLDEYLAGELAAAAATRFADHVASCDECRTAVDAQQWIDGLLQSPLAAQLESPPAELADSLKTTLRQFRQRARAIACAFAAAAAILIAVGWTVWAFRGAGHVAKENRDQAGQHIKADGAAAGVDRPSAEQAGTTASVPKATVTGGPDTLVVPVDSPYPDVTIVRVYQVYQPKFAATENPRPATGGGQFSWRDDFNGGTP